jgi:hypothetical protein
MHILLLHVCVADPPAPVFCCMYMGDSEGKEGLHALTKRWHGCSSSALLSCALTNQCMHATCSITRFLLMHFLHCFVVLWWLNPEDPEDPVSLVMLRCLGLNRCHHHGMLDYKVAGGPGIVEGTSPAIIPPAAVLSSLVSGDYLRGRR